MDIFSPCMLYPSCCACCIHVSGQLHRYCVQEIRITKWNRGRALATGRCLVNGYLNGENSRSGMRWNFLLQQEWAPQIDSGARCGMCRVWCRAGAELFFPVVSLLGNKVFPVRLKCCLLAVTEKHTRLWRCRHNLFFLILRGYHVARSAIA